MHGRTLTKAVLAATAAVTLAACATTSLQSTWKNPAAAPLNLKGKKVVALVVIDEEALRYAAEDEAAREITAHGAIGVPAYRLLPQAQIRDKEQGPGDLREGGDRGRRRAAAGREGEGAQRVFLGEPGLLLVLGTRVLGRGRRLGRGWGDGYLRTDVILVVETLVYSLQQNSLVWASQSQTMNPTQVGSFVRELSKTLGTEMEKQGLLG